MYYTNYTVTGQGQGTIVFYCTHPGPGPCPSPSPGPVQCVWTIARSLNVADCVSGTVNLFDVVCKYHQRTALKPISNGMNNGIVYDTERVNKA